MGVTQSNEIYFVEEYKEVAATFRKKTFKGNIRKLALDFLSVGIRKRKKKLSPCIQFVLFHHLFSDEVDGVELLFERLSEEYEFISFSDAVEKIHTNEIDKPYLCFTSDDGFKNNLRAVEFFARFDIKCCFFVCPNMIGEKNFHIIKRFNQNRLNLPPIEYLDWNDINYILKQGHEVGGHTQNHLRLSECNNNQLSTELNGSFEMLKSKIGDVKHFAWPYGLFKDISVQARKMVFEAGYISCASGERGVHIPVSDLSQLKDISNVCIRRDNFEFNWSSNHLLYFLKKNINTASENSTFFIDKQ